MFGFEVEQVRANEFDSELFVPIRKELMPPFRRRDRYQIKTAAARSPPYTS